MADLHKKTKISMNESLAAPALADVSREARAEEISGASRAAPDPEVAVTAKRRQFSSKEKRRILAAAERCSESGAIGALLRREGIYSSQLATWRRQREASERFSRSPRLKLDVGRSRRVGAPAVSCKTRPQVGAIAKHRST